MNKPLKPSALPEAELYRRVALEKLKQLEMKFGNGDRMALLLAVRICAQHDLVMPAWVAEAFIAAFDRAWNLQCGSWTEAFGPSRPETPRIDKLRWDRHHARNVIELIEKLRAAIDDAKAAKKALANQNLEQVTKTYLSELAQVPGYDKTAAEELEKINQRKKRDWDAIKRKGQKHIEAMFHADVVSALWPSVWSEDSPFDRTKAEELLKEIGGADALWSFDGTIKDDKSENLYTLVGKVHNVGKTKIKELWSKYKKAASQD